MLILIIPISVANGIGSQYLNAWFLNKHGVKSTAIITSDIETTSTLNDQYIHNYEAIVRKQDGKYVSTYFSSTFATVYPIENAIHIPRMGKTFPVKYIVGYEKNMVILYNEYEEGQKLRRYEKQAPIISARMKYEADKTNKEFIEGYIAALKAYTEVYQDDNSEKYNRLIKELHQELDRLK
ncbi:MAG: hypothetical protein WC622_06710 [Pedobacter sp.]|uniref:hypothetical protein n=1 Tax=Pedobacter sp. TaxID=1411316 RepID=UPI0035681A7B